MVSREKGGILDEIFQYICCRAMPILADCFQHPRHSKILSSQILDFVNAVRKKDDGVTGLDRPFRRIKNQILE